MPQLLQEIWSGVVRPSQRHSAVQPDLVRKISLPQSTVFLEERDGTAIRLYRAEQELEHDLTVADALAEEFNIFVEDRGVVAVVPTPKNTSGVFRNFDWNALFKHLETQRL